MCFKCMKCGILVKFINNIITGSTISYIVSKGVVSSVAQKTTEQANLVGDAVVTGANEVSEKTVEGLGTVVGSTGLVINPVNTFRITICVKLCV